MAPPAARTVVVGRSARGRAIRAVVRGDRTAPRRVLVVGVVHGNEPAGLAVVGRPERLPLPAGVALYLVPTLTPDGLRAGARQNAHRVDLNRNFPCGWRRQGRPGSTYYSGPRPLSEPESRAAVRLVGRVRPS